MNGSTVVVVLGREGFAVDAAVRGHHVALDEPLAGHGTDTGPTPVEGLLAALGACTAMTLRMYGDRKQWALRGVRVRVSHALLDGADHIHREVAVEGDFSEEQLARLLDIANRCPVHRLLTRNPVVSTEIARQIGGDPVQGSQPPAGDLPVGTRES
jgi:putative redox protein